MEATLKPGDMLYVPRGFAHVATGDGGLSVHLSFIFRELRTRRTAWGRTPRPQSDQAADGGKGGREAAPYPVVVSGVTASARRGGAT